MHHCSAKVLATTRKLQIKRKFIAFNWMTLCKSQSMQNYLHQLLIPNTSSYPYRTASNQTNNVLILLLVVSGPKTHLSSHKRIDSFGPRDCSEIT